MSRVVPLFPEMEGRDFAKTAVKRRKRSHLPQTTPAFDEAWAAYPPSGRARQSRAEAFPIWSEIASEVGEELLLSCVKRYTLENKDAKRDCGAPGLERWLKWGRWDNWRPTGPVDADVRLSACFPDTTIRQACLARHGEPWCISYLDRCEWVDGVIVTTSATVFGVMSRQPIFRESGWIVELKSI